MKSRPPLGLLIGALAALLVSALMFQGVAGIDPPTANLVGFVAGSVLGFVLLGWFSVVDNRRRVGNYGDWSIPSRPTMRCVALAGWALGVLHAYFLALEITRHV